MTTTDAPYRIWGNNLEAAAVQQLKNACTLPVAVSGALMPDAHVGYGLPIGGVLATQNAVIPYAVGVDIACRMKITVLDLPVTRSTDDRVAFDERDRAGDAFRGGRPFKARRAARRPGRRLARERRDRELKDRAWAQLGTSGSGNHFVEFGRLTFDDDAVGLPQGNISRFSATAAAGERARRSRSTTAGSRVSSIRSSRRSSRIWRGSSWPRKPARNTGRRWS